nr:retrovirus-related Pol polyprotein from transposon TNT 1-94 [Tanacetum cinerariifolium]
MGTVRFSNDNFAAITRYGDYVQGNLTICHVYYVEGLGHNLFSVGQFCDGDLEVTFHSNTCYIRNMEGEDLLTSSRDSNLYTISISEMVASSTICLMSKATSTKSWLWNLRLSYLIFDETPDTIINYIIQIQSNMKANVLKVRSGNGTEFKNVTLKSFYEKQGIMHHTSIARTPQQNGPGTNYLNFQDSSDEVNEILSQQDLDNLFGPIYEEYYAQRTPKVLDNSVTNTLDNEDTPSSSSSIIIEDNHASQTIT